MIIVTFIIYLSIDRPQVCEIGQIADLRRQDSEWVIADAEKNQVFQPADPAWQHRQLIVVEQ